MNAYQKAFYSMFGDHPWLTPTTTHPEPETGANQRDILLQALRNGERLTVMSAMNDYGVYALSQRIGDIIRAGHKVEKGWYETVTGKRVRMYWMEGV
jgi:hypothetical protein